MDKELFEETESKIFKYFNKDKMIKSLNEKLKILDKQIESIDNDLRECNISIEPESSSPNFEERVQTSGVGIGYAEREVMRVTELQIKRRISKQLERQRVLEQLDSIEISCNDIGWKVEEFKGELKEILELLYKDRLSENAIAEKMHIGQSQINKRKQQIIRKIALWDGWNIESIGECGGSYGGIETHQYFKIKMKDKSINTFHFISHEGKSEGEKARLEIKKLFNEYNNFPETFLLYTNVYGRIDEESVQVGYEVKNILDEYEYFTLNEVDILKKQFKIKDNGQRSLVYIQVFEIESNIIKNPIEERWIKQLKTLGYDISLLKYTLKTK